MAARLDEGDLDLGEQHEINVTPFIDVMLVLLIIFMIAAPLATVDIPVELPKSTATQQRRPDKPIFLTVRRDMSLAVGEARVEPDGLGAALARATSGDREARIFLRADRSVPYGELMGVMNRLRAAGYLKIGLVGLDSAPGR